MTTKPCGVQSRSRRWVPRMSRSTRNTKASTLSLSSNNSPGAPNSLGTILVTVSVIQIKNIQIFRK